jgi:ligand-binding SRPBCC domain-containing protein
VTVSKTYTLDQLQIIPRPRHEVFDFFSRAENLEKLTPDLLRFSIKTPLPIEMKPGTLIDYRLALFGVPMKWRTKIEVWEPEVRFVDTQLKGPYKLWHHEHLFRDVPGGTEMTDHLRYQVGFGPFGEVARVLFVTRTVEKIFAYRREAVARFFDSPA